MTKFGVVVLTEAADFLLETESNMSREEKGIRVESPFAITEEEQARPTVAEEIFIPYESVHAVQYGEFDHELEE